MAKNSITPTVTPDVAVIKCRVLVKKLGFMRRIRD